MEQQIACLTHSLSSWTSVTLGFWTNLEANPRVCFGTSTQEVNYHHSPLQDLDSYVAKHLRRAAARSKSGFSGPRVFWPPKGV